MAKRILVTGACGFAGSHIVEEAVRPLGAEIIALDCLTYAGRLDRLWNVAPHVQYVHHDFRQPFTDALIKTLLPIDYIIHNGAESHVMRSFENPRLFAESNIIGTLNVLEAARKICPKKIIYVSTDEVFGPSKTTPFVEEDALAPTNPYAATKAGGEFLAYSYFRSFGLPVLISRTMNMFGERQHPEKCVPLMIKKILNGEKIQVHGELFIDGQGEHWRCGSRQWLHARDQANALLFLLANGIPGEKYHIAGVHKTNLEIYQFIARTLQRLSDWEYTEALGPVHDFSYSLDDSKIRAMGWAPQGTFEENLRQTVLWTEAHRKWLEE